MSGQKRDLKEEEFAGKPVMGRTSYGYIRPDDPLLTQKLEDHLIKNDLAMVGVLGEGEKLPGRAAAAKKGDTLVHLGPEFKALHGKVMPRAFAHALREATLDAADRPIEGAVFKAAKWASLSTRQRLVGRIIELAAQGAYVLYTRKAKKAAPDGKLTKDQRMTAMQTAKDLARSDAKMQGLEDAPEIKDDRMLEAALELEVTKAKAVAGAAPRHRGTGLPR